MRVGNIYCNSFKGYQAEINEIGQKQYRFNYPHDTNTQHAKVEFYKTVSTPNGLEIAGDKIKTVDIKKEGAVVNFNDIPSVEQHSMLAYRVLVDGTPKEDTGYSIENQTGKYNILNQFSANHGFNGSAVLVMPDTQRPGAYYEDYKSKNTGKLVYDINKQKISESIIRTTSNRGKGGLAGLEYDVEKFKELGVKTVFSTPIWGGDNKSGSHYWNKNDMLISHDIGNSENYETFIQKLFKNGLQYVDDAAITSEGLEGIHLQYALRWAKNNPSTYYWFKMDGIKNAPIGFGIVPKYNENLRHRVINPSVVYDISSNKIKKNPNYNPDKETYFQIYDDSQITKGQKEKLDNAIEIYENIKSGNEISINNSDDTIVNYVFEINPREYEKRLEDFAKINKHTSNPIELNSPDGTLFIGQFSNFKIGRNAEGAVFWDANKDMVKRNFFISGYDEKILQAIPDFYEREQERKRIVQGTYEVRDYALQTIRHKAETIRDIQTLYTAQQLQKVQTEEDLQHLIKKGDLPEVGNLSSAEINNILKGWYNLSPKGLEEKDDITIKSLMKLPLDSLELGENTLGVLSTPFFSKRAYNEETLGLSRFEMFQNNKKVQNNYRQTYNLINNLFRREIREFADEIIYEVNKTSSEKLLDENKNYTEYGEYVIDIVGKDIAKYAFLKAITGSKLQAKIMPEDVLEGKITYNYPELRNITTLKSLGINSVSPETEAKELAELIERGMFKLNKSDIEFVANSVSKRINKTNTNSFRLAEAIVNKAGIGLNVRFDAAKDIADMDAVRNGDTSFDESWDNLIDFWGRIIQTVKKVNPNSYSVAEMTDIHDMIKSSYDVESAYSNESDLTESMGAKYKNVLDAMARFYQNTGVTSEAGYSYTFTNLLNLFSKDFETASGSEDEKTNLINFKNRIKELFTSENIDYIRNLWTFMDNHDKPSVIHGFALDMPLFHANFDAWENGSMTPETRRARQDALTQLSNSDSWEEVPDNIKARISNTALFGTVSSKAVAMSKLMRSAINNSIEDESVKQALKRALADLTNGNYLGEGQKFDINNLVYIETSKEAMRKNAFGTRDFETVINMILKQAQFSSGLNLSQAQKDEILEKVFRSATEPAVEKALIYTSYLVGLPGVPCVYFRDILGGLGYDEKSKNIYLQNRNTVKWSQIEEEGPLKEYRTKLYNSFKDILSIRNKKELEVLSNGTPYALHNDETPYISFLYQNGLGDTAITIMNSSGIKVGNREEYEDKTGTINDNNKYVPSQKTLELEEILLPSSIALTAGTVFVNALGNDNSEYIVEEVKKGIYRVVNSAKDAKIKLNGETTKHGLMILKQKTIFKGRNLNKNYNVSSLRKD